MRALRLTSNDVVVRVSDRRILQAFVESLGVPPGSIGDVYRIIDKLDRTPPETSAEKLRALGAGQEAIDRILTIADVSCSRRLTTGPEREPASR